MLFNLTWEEQTITVIVDMTRRCAGLTAPWTQVPECTQTAVRHNTLPSLSESVYITAGLPQEMDYECFMNDSEPLLMFVLGRSEREMEGGICLGPYAVNVA